jgi:hypothetical protein
MTRKFNKAVAIVITSNALSAACAIASGELNIGIFFAGAAASSVVLMGALRGAAEERVSNNAHLRPPE